MLVLLATPAGTVSGAVSDAVSGVSDAAQRAKASVADRVFAADRVITNKHLAWIFAPAILVLVLVARRHVLHQ